MLFFTEPCPSKLDSTFVLIQNKHDEQRKQLTEKFNKALAIQSAEALAEKARLLTSADQTQLDHQKQLVELQQENDGLNRKVKQCERNKQVKNMIVRQHD